jgi:hypothetical protein
MNMSERGHEGLSDGDFLNCMFFQVEQLVAVRLERCPSVVATPFACVTRLFAKTGSGQDSQQQWSSCFLFSFFLLLYRMGGIRSC